MDLIGIIDPQKIVEWFPEAFRAVLPLAPVVLANIYNVIVVISVPICFILIYFIFYSIIGNRAMMHKVSEMLKAPVEEAFSDVPVQIINKFSERWLKIMQLVNTDSQNDWVRSIMEADILLDELLEKNGYTGDSVGEKLKRVEKGDMMNLDLAWSAHLIRNKIAHEPNFVLSQYEAKRAIESYRKVFDEYGMFSA